MSRQLNEKDCENFKQPKQVIKKHSITAESKSTIIVYNILVLPDALRYPC